MVLLAGVALVSIAVAGSVALLDPVTTDGKQAPIFYARTAASELLPSPRPDPTQVRIVGAPFVPNINPRER